MTKVNIGDKVKVVSGEYVTKCAGRIGVCVGIEGDWLICNFGFGFDGRSHHGSLMTCWGVHKGSAELVERRQFKEGDRVRLTEVNEHPAYGEKGDIGTIVGFGVSDRPQVKFDKTGHSLFANPSILELIEAAPAVEATKASTKINAGDKVRYVGFHTYAFTTNKIYEIGGCYHGSGTNVVGVVEDDCGNNNGWDVKYFELVEAVPVAVPVDPAVPAATQPAHAPLSVAIGQRVRSLDDDAWGDYKKGSIIEVTGIRIDFVDASGARRTIPLNKFTALTSDELAAIDAEAERTEIIERLREEFAVKYTEPKFAPGNIVKIDSPWNGEATVGIVLSGPDNDNDYKVGYISDLGDADEDYFDPDELKIAA
jgi:hypothetical protein